MSNKKRPTLFVNIVFPIIIVALIVLATIYDDLSALFIIITIVCLFLWLCLYSIMKNAEIARLPVLESPAILFEKIQEDHRSVSLYFLSFKLEDGSKKLIKVDRDVYASFEKSEKGVLKYKQVGKFPYFMSFEKE